MLIYIFWGYFGGDDLVFPYVLLVLLLISEVSDALDGYIARKWDQVSDLGKILDPMADSLFRISVFLSFTYPPTNVPLILVFVLIYRDSVISTLRTICAFRGFALAARLSGKVKAILQGVSAIVIVLLMIPYSTGALSQDKFQYLSFWITAIVALYTLLSGIDYIVANARHIHSAFTKKKL